MHSKKVTLVEIIHSQCQQKPPNNNTIQYRTHFSMYHLLTQLGSPKLCQRQKYWTRSIPSVCRYWDYGAPHSYTWKDKTVQFVKSIFLSPYEKQLCNGSFSLVMAFLQRRDKSLSWIIPGQTMSRKLDRCIARALHHSTVLPRNRSFPLCPSERMFYKLYFRTRALGAF